MQLWNILPPHPHITPPPMFSTALCRRMIVQLTQLGLLFMHYYLDMLLSKYYTIVLIELKSLSLTGIQTQV